MTPLFPSIVGIPLGLAGLEPTPVSPLPLGARIVDAGDAGAFDHG